MGRCNGELVFITVAPHDYIEGGFRAPLGAQSFPSRARAFARRMRRRNSTETCLRVTFRMLPQMIVLANELAVKITRGVN